MQIDIKGLSTFFLWSIPAALGLAAIYWLIFVRGFMEVRRGIVMDSRHNEIVGAKSIPRGAIQMAIVDVKPDGPVIERAEIVGSDLTVWVRNDGQRTVQGVIDAVEVEWKAIAPDGTIVSSGHGYCNFGVSLKPQQKSECSFSIEADRRMKRLEVAIR